MNDEGGTDTYDRNGNYTSDLRDGGSGKSRVYDGRENYTDDSNGNVTYQSTPPPDEAVEVEKSDILVNSPETVIKEDEKKAYDEHCQLAGNK